MKDIKSVLYDFLGVDEAFKVPDALMSVLFSSEKNKLLQAVASVYDFTHDSLRDYFQSEQNNRKDFMQDYTPDSICTLLSNIVDEKNAILDVCAGTGALSTSLIINNHVQHVRCEELSQASISFLLLNMSLRNMDCEILRKDVLSEEVFTCYKLTKGDKFSDIEIVDCVTDVEKWDTIVSNPPYSLKYEISRDDHRFDGYDLPPKGKADYGFVIDAVSRLSDNGKAYFILPHGILFRGNQEAKIRKQLIDNNLIETVIGLPGNMFLNTSIPTVLIVLNKKKTDTDILFIDASNTCKAVDHVNIFTDEQIDAIADAYRNKRRVEKFSDIASLDSIKENDYNLNIPRYVDTFDDEEEIELEDLLAELTHLNEDDADEASALCDMLMELKVTPEEMAELKDIANTLKWIAEEEKQQIEQLIPIAEMILNKSIGFIYLPLLDVCTVERAKPGKLYKAGSTILQISATKGQVIYLAEDMEVEPKYAVCTPVDGVDGWILYNFMFSTVRDFCYTYQAGLNISMNDLKFWNIPFPIIADPVTCGVSMDVIQKVGGGLIEHV